MQGSDTERRDNKNTSKALTNTCCTERCLPGSDKMNSSIISTSAIGIQKINAALDILNFSYRCSNSGDAEFVIGLYAKDLDLDSNVYLPAENKSTADTEYILYNQLMLAVAGLSLAMDEALQTTLGKTSPCKNTHLSQLKCVVYMLRCAFAHDICEPKWEIRKTGYRDLFILEAPANLLKARPIVKNKIELDFQKLNGKRVCF